MSCVTNTIVFCNRRWRLEQLLLETQAHDRVDRAERLVHQEHRRIGRERAGHADALLLTTGELARVARRELGVETHELHQLVDARVRARLVPSEQLGNRRDVAADRAVREQPDLLDHVTDREPQLVRLLRRTRLGRQR